VLIEGDMEALNEEQLHSTYQIHACKKIPNCNSTTLPLPIGYIRSLVPGLESSMNTLYIT